MLAGRNELPARCESASTATIRKLNGRTCSLQTKTEKCSNGPAVYLILIRALLLVCPYRVMLTKTSCPAARLDRGARCGHKERKIEVGGFKESRILDGPFSGRLSLPDDVGRRGQPCWNCASGEGWCHVHLRTDTCDAATKGRIFASTSAGSWSGREPPWPAALSARQSLEPGHLELPGGSELGDSDREHRG